MLVEVRVGGLQEYWQVTQAGPDSTQRAQPVVINMHGFCSAAINKAFAAQRLTIDKAFEAQRITRLLQRSD